MAKTSKKNRGKKAKSLKKQISQIDLTAKVREEVLLDIIQMNSRLHSIQDTDILLEEILTEARTALNADAGSIYIIINDELHIQYAQNDTLQRKLPPGQKLPYSVFSFPINKKTLAGYVACTKEIVNEPDVYHIDPDKTYKFGRVSDISTGYRTISNLTIPLLSTKDSVLGVLQILNALDEKGEPCPFKKEDEIYLTHFASYVASAIEQTSLTRAMVMRMMRVSELRDPKETGPHVNRVAHYSVEIYDRWAFKKGIPKREKLQYRDVLKISAMLHDVGKVAIPDAILKKEGKLTVEEFEVIKSHTWLGAKLFEPISSEFDQFAFDIALRHHENWNGTGYPGHINLKDAVPDLTDVKGLKEEEIPLGARIVALADVFDALSSKRSYKEKWDDEDIIKEMRSLSGIKFDPELFEAFLEVFSRLVAIRTRFS